MTSVLLDPIPRPLDEEALFKTLRLRDNSRHAEKVKTMIAAALAALDDRPG